MPRAVPAYDRAAIEFDVARHLWRRVIEQAFLDATYAAPAANRKQGGQGSRPALSEQWKARAWLTGHSPDFVLVCEFAGFNADAVRRRACELEGEGWPAQDLPDRGEIKRAQLARARATRLGLSEAA